MNRWHLLQIVAKSAAVIAAGTAAVVLAQVAVLVANTPRLPHARKSDLKGKEQAPAAPPLSPPSPPPTPTTTTTTTTTTTSSPVQTLRLLVFGDSVAGGVGCTSNNQALAGCVARAITKNSNVHVEWEVLGMSGYTASDMREYLIPSLQARLETSQAFDVCVISVGVNHVLSLHHPDTYAYQLTQLFISLRQVLSPHCLVLCNSMPPMGKFPQVSYLWPLCDVMSRYAHAMSNVTRRVCEETGMALCVNWEADVSSMNSETIQRMMASDGFHPAAPACDLMAEPIAKRVEEEKKRSEQVMSSGDHNVGVEIIDRTPHFTVKHSFCADDCLPFWVADMDLGTAPCVLAAIQRRAEHPTFGYTIQPLDLWRGVSDWLLKRHGWNVDPSSDFIFTPNLVTATFSCLRAFTSEGDAVAMCLPLYHPLQNATSKSGRRLVCVDLVLRLQEGDEEVVVDGGDGGGGNGERMEHSGESSKQSHGAGEKKRRGSSSSSSTDDNMSDVHASSSYEYTLDINQMKATLQRENVRLLIFCHPHNPSGRVWKREELASVVDVCKELNIVLVSDEIHSDLMLFGHQHVPLQLIARERDFENCVTLSSPGKTFNTAGLHAGFVVIQNRRNRELYLRAVEHAYLHFGSTFATTAMMACYTLEGWMWVENLVKFLEAQVMLVEKFCRLNIPEIVVMRPGASFLVWMDCSKLGLDSVEGGAQSELCQFFQQHAKVHLSDGFTFGGPKHAHYQRMNVGCSRKMLLKGLRRMQRAVRRLKRRREMKV